VRLQVRTDLKLSEQRGSDGSLRFLGEEFGGVTIGQVVGIDGNGDRATGSMQYEDGVLELRLPQSFVDGAALPLVLDPMIGSEIAIGSSSTYHQHSPDVADDAATDR